MIGVLVSWVSPSRSAAKLWLVVTPCVTRIIRVIGILLSLPSPGPALGMHSFIKLLSLLFISGVGGRRIFV